MFLLVTGASGAGKSTVRRTLEPALDGRVEAVELATLGITPEWSLSWRHRVVEQVVQRAIEADRLGRHFLLCGDPVPPGEVIATPSGDRLGPMHVCLLDVAPEAQRARLLARGDDPALVPNHVAFAEWMRHHVADPGHRPEVIMGGGWDEMRWDRWVGTGAARPWTSYAVDTTVLAPADVATQVLAWIRTCVGEVA
jgi:hypothetical protein